jgi:hypothetical protein
MSDYEKYEIPKHASRSNDSVYLENGVIKSDLLETFEGDWVLGTQEDLLIANDSEALAQRALHFLRTPKNSSFVYEEFGCRLQDYIGKALNPTTLANIERDLFKDLSDSGIIYDENNTEVLPFSDHTVIIHLSLIDSNGLPVEGIYLFDSFDGSVEVQGGKQV